MSETEERPRDNGLEGAEPADAKPADAEPADAKSRGAEPTDAGSTSAVQEGAAPGRDGLVGLIAARRAKARRLKESDPSAFPYAFPGAEPIANILDAYEHLA